MQRTECRRLRVRTGCGFRSDPVADVWSCDAEGQPVTPIAEMKASTEPGPLGPDELQLPDSPAGGPAVTEASDRWVGHTFDATSATTTEIAAPPKMSLG